MKQRPENSKPFKQAVVDEVESHQLTTQELQQLMTKQAAVLNEPSPNPKPKTTVKPWLAFAASLLLAIGGAMLWEQTAARNVVDQIAQEVVTNHLKLKPLDVRASSIEGIQSYFTQLDFAPVSSGLLPRFSLPEQSLLGGRYCSIKGVTAAQLRYQPSPQDLSTLYEVAYEPARFGVMPDIDKGEQPKTVMKNGLSVSMWVEKGLLMVLVTES